MTGRYVLTATFSMYCKLRNPNAAHKWVVCRESLLSSKKVCYQVNKWLKKKGKNSTSKQYGDLYENLSSEDSTPNVGHAGYLTHPYVYTTLWSEHVEQTCWSILPLPLSDFLDFLAVRNYAELFLLCLISLVAEANPATVLEGYKMYKDGRTKSLQKESSGRGEVNLCQGLLSEVSWCKQ